MTYDRVTTSVNHIDAHVMEHAYYVNSNINRVSSTGGGKGEASPPNSL